MALVPSLRILKVFSQPWEGDVTMVLPSTYMQIKKSITNPTADDLRTACRQARQIRRCGGLLCNCISACWWCLRAAHVRAAHEWTWVRFQLAVRAAVIARMCA